MLGSGPPLPKNLILTSLDTIRSPQLAACHDYAISRIQFLGSNWMPYQEMKNTRGHGSPWEPLGALGSHVAALGAQPAPLPICRAEQRRRSISETCMFKVATEEAEDFTEP